MCLQEVISESPKWTDIVSALSSAIGVPLVLWTLYKLMTKDKERESEIESLSIIATRLTDMQIEVEKRYRASKKPFINIELDNSAENRIELSFTNLNLNTSITNFELTNGSSPNINVEYIAINNLNGQQKFSLIIYGKESEILGLYYMNYTTEEGYTFIQDILIWKDNNEFVFHQK